jgi:hypothetical protein
LINDYVIYFVAIVKFLPIIQLTNFDTEIGYARKLSGVSRYHGPNMNQIEILLNAINNLSPRIPVTVDLWSVKEIAAYLMRSEAAVREPITALPGFPQAIRLPVAGSKGRGQPLWKPKEVIAWTEKHQENRIAWSSLSARSLTDGA